MSQISNVPTLSGSFIPIDIDHKLICNSFSIMIQLLFDRAPLREKSLGKERQYGY